jgi:hypothetical protein
MPHEDVKFLSSARLALRKALEERLLAYSSVQFVSVGFGPESLLITVGTDNHRLAVVEATCWAAQISEQEGLQLEVHILKGRTSG